MPRVFQHLVALDCELLLDSGAAGLCVVDDDVAASFAPQLRLFVDFLAACGGDVSGLLLPLFNVYLVELPRAAVVQFVFFYVASLNRGTADNFVGFLLAKLFDAQASTRARANAALYLASFLVRARFVDGDFAAAVIDYVADFAFRYAAHVRAESPDEFKLDLDAHACFYYAVQCVAYVVCWRWRQWRHAGFRAAERWHLRELVGNPLRAIDAIDRNTAELFRAIAVCERVDETPAIGRIAVWFPFDPSPLEEIAELVRDEYAVWAQCDPDTDDIDAMLDSALARVCQDRLISIEQVLGG
jgi:RNA polymerase I-specific transcription initiation factor RRN3